MRSDERIQTLRRYIQDYKSDIEEAEQTIKLAKVSINELESEIKRIEETGEVML